MKFETGNGTLMDTEGGWASSATAYAKEKGIKCICVLATMPNGVQEYVLLEREGEGMVSIFSSQSYEGIVCHIDALHLSQKLI